MMRSVLCVSRLMVCVALLGAVSPVHSQKPLRINLGTVAPEGSLWHQVLQQMGQDWERVSGGKVTVRIYASGIQGDEVEMLRRVRIGQLQAVALSGAGLPHADRGVSCLQIPMLIESYEELDYLRDRITPKLEQRLEVKGYTLLNWGDVGWVHFFTKKPARTLAEIRKMKLFTSAGDPEAEKLYKEFGFQPVPLAVTDMLMALQTGLIESFDVPPLFALLDQSFGLAKNMIEVKWAPLVGATIISKRTWERIPEDLRPELLNAARKAGERLRGDIRKLGDDAVVEMQKRGLKVIKVDPATLAQWRTEAESAYPKLREHLVPGDLFDEVIRLRNEFRAQDRKARTAASASHTNAVSRSHE